MSGRRAAARPAARTSRRPASAWAGPWLVAAFGAGLAILAFGFHPVGDYFTESDFYGGYIGGARALARGVFDPARYGVYGPGYEVVLAAADAVLRDGFVAARSISVLAAVAVLAAAWVFARARAGPRAGAWLVVLLGVNPTFVRYAISAGTDMLACGFFAAGLAAAVHGVGARGAGFAGLMAGLAALTRYNLASLVPGAMLGMFARMRGRAGVTAAALVLGAFAATVAPFVAASLSRGQMPAATLWRDAGFYLDDAPAAALENRYGGGARSRPPVAGPGLPRLLQRAATGVVRHAAADAQLLLGWPAAGLVFAGLAWLAVRRRARTLAPLLAPVAFTYLALAPVFHTERYSLALLPAFLAPAAFALADAETRSRAVARAAGAIGIAVVLGTGARCITLQRQVHAALPRETLAAGAAIRSRAVAGDRVLARKGHTAYAAGLDPVLFPDVTNLDELSAFCRRERVRWLYYSWYEFRLRPQFAYLLDTTSAIPGLTPIHATTDKPSATYAVGPGFGERPAWWGDLARHAELRERVKAIMRDAEGGLP